MRTSPRKKGVSMENIMLLADSLKLIEDTLGENLSTDEIASRCACSRSTLEKLFRYVYHRPGSRHGMRLQLQRSIYPCI